VFEPMSRPRMGSLRFLEQGVDVVGIKRLEVLRWATVSGGLLTRIDDPGLVRQGYWADVAGVDGNPSVDITLLQTLAKIKMAMRPDAPWWTGRAPLAEGEHSFSQSRNGSWV
jgi:imidazolonepropionase-like amidohydrolase